MKTRPLRSTATDGSKQHQRFLEKTRVGAPKRKAPPASAGAPNAPSDAVIATRLIATTRGRRRLSILRRTSVMTRLRLHDVTSEHQRSDAASDPEAAGAQHDDRTRRENEVRLFSSRSPCPCGWFPPSWTTAQAPSQLSEFPTFGSRGPSSPCVCHARRRDDGWVHDVAACRRLHQRLLRSRGASVRREMETSTTWLMSPRELAAIVLGVGTRAAAKWQKLARS
jgi:hypothetical protein